MEKELITKIVLTAILYLIGIVDMIKSVKIYDRETKYFAIRCKVDYFIIITIGTILYTFK